MQEFLTELNTLFGEILKGISSEISKMDNSMQVGVSIVLVLLLFYFVFFGFKKPKEVPPTHGDVTISVASENAEELDAMMSAEIEKQKAVLTVADKDVGDVSVGDKANEGGVWKQEAHVSWKNK